MDNSFQWLLGDHLGSTSITANTSGVLDAKMLYKPCPTPAFGVWGCSAALREGETRYTTGTTPTTYHYTGQREQSEIGLYYYNARWPRSAPGTKWKGYDTATGRFAQADTIVPGVGNPQAWDRFTYTYNNPINYTDPTGHQICSDDGFCGNLNSSAYWNTVILELSSSYGITFSGKWSQKDKLAALTGVVVVGGALARISGRSSADTFGKVFSKLTLSATRGNGNKWTCQRNAAPSGISCSSGSFDLNPRLMAHELGHVFNAMYVNGGHPNSPYSVLGNTTISDTDGLWVTGIEYDPFENKYEWTRGYRGYQLVDGYYDDPSLFHGPVDWADANSVGEEYADMFMNWAFNSFAPNPAGSARYNWMSGEVARALSVMLP